MWRDKDGAEQRKSWYARCRPNWSIGFVCLLSDRLVHLPDDDQPVQVLVYDSQKQKLKTNLELVEEF